MERNIKTSLHNRFDFVVTDAASGEVKQLATSYNIILDYYFDYLIGRSTGKLSYMQVGTGTGTLSQTRRELFAYLGSKRTETVETVRAYPTSYIRKKIVLLPGDYVGQRITEVGFASYDSRTSLMTHSMLKDSEGNQIAILKTATDVITIYGTFYLTIGQPADDTCVLASPQNSVIIANALADADAGVQKVILGAHTMLPTADALENRKMYERTNIYLVSDRPNNRWVFPTTRFDYNFANNCMVSSIGVPRIAAWKLPNTSIFPTVLLSNLAVGTGDGEQTAFNCPVPKMVVGSDVVRKNGVILERGRDYEIDYENNCAELPELFISADPANCDVSGGQWNTYGGGKRFCVWNNVNDNPRQSIGPNQPLAFDFRQPIEVNRLIIPKGSLSANGWSTGIITTSIGFDYSEDGENWTNLHTTPVVSYGDVAADEWFEPSISARYWRLTSSGTILSFGSYDCPNIRFGRVVPGLTFTTAPAAGDIITMDCRVDRPFKNPNWILDFGCSVSFERA